VFDLYKVHQDAILLPVQFNSPEYTYGNEKIPAVNISASRDTSGAVHISLVNIDPAKKITVRTTLKGINYKKVEGQILTSPKFTDINTFDQPDKVKPAAFSGAKKDGADLVVELPAQSLVVLELR
jgi:alpha-N-arabinofuranosidase